MDNYRNQSGMSLPTALILAVLVGAWLTSMYAYILPTYQKAVSARFMNVLRSGCEASLDWAVNQMNASIAQANGNNNNNGSNSGSHPLLAIDAGAAGTAVTTQVPSYVFTDDQGNATGVSGTITVTNTAAPTWSYVYDPTIDPQAPIPPNSPNGVATNGWRIIRADCKFGKLKKSLQVILRSDYTSEPGVPVPIFNHALFGGSQVSFSGNASTDSYDSRISGPGGTSTLPLQGDVGTNGTFSVSGNGKVGGALNVTSVPMASNAIVVTGSGNAGVNGDLYANGSTSGFSSSNTGEALPPGTPNTYQTKQSNPQVVLPPVPQAPPGSTNLGSISLSGNNSMTLTSGNYIVSGLSISGNGKINIDNTDGPVNIYVQGGSGNISISGNGINNASGVANNVRLWYSGTGSFSISGNGNWTGTVYAPNSNLTMSGNGTNSGALVGKTVTLSGNGTFHYDRDLGAEGPTFVPSTVAVIDRMNTVSWQEL